MLYDNAEELEVRHVIFLPHYNVDIYASEDQVSEGDLFVKRNCIRLTKKKSDDELTSNARPYFMFSDNTSEKEDFYHALLQNQDSTDEAVTPLLFDPSHLVKLIQQLHSSEESLQTRWFNAILGRIFLALYKTKSVEDYIRSKISKKISRVRKPAFIDSIYVRAIDLGDAAPIFTNQRLREMNLNGNMMVESDVKYNGGFRLEIAATARIELGPRFKAREVSLILVGTLKQLEGHVLVRIKPPPTNRLWITFEKMPRMDMSIEPIVSSRQVTYGIIVRAIESRIRDVVKDTLVLPNWDDIPFLDSLSQGFRGGIWAENVGFSTVVDNEIEDGSLKKRTATKKEIQQPLTDQSTPSSGKSFDALLPDTRISHDAGKPPKDGVDGSPSPADRLDGDTGLNVPAAFGPEKSRTLQTDSVATAALPTNTHDMAPIIKSESKMRHNRQDTKSIAEDLSGSSQATSLPTSPLGSSSDLHKIVYGGKTCDPSKHREESMASIDRSASFSSFPFQSHTEQNDLLDPSVVPTTAVATKSLNEDSSLGSRDTPHQSPGSTTTGPRKWGWGVLIGQGNQRNLAKGIFTTEFDKLPAQPMGRGQPLPPPGVPLPGPQKQSWPTPSLGVGKRKPVPVSSTSKGYLRQRQFSRESLKSSQDRAIRMPAIIGNEGLFGDELPSSAPLPKPRSTQDVDICNSRNDTVAEQSEPGTGCSSSTQDV